MKRVAEYAAIALVCLALAATFSFASGLGGGGLGGGSGFTGVFVGDSTWTGDLIPGADNTYALGTTSTLRRWIRLVVGSAGIVDNAGNTRLGPTSSNATTINGAVGDSSSAFAVKSSNVNTLSTAGASIHGFYNDNLSTLKARIDKDGFLISPAVTVTVADDGAGTKPASTLTISSSLMLYACNDATGVTVTVSETGAQEGSRSTIVGTGTGNCEFADSAGVLELSAGTACTMGSTETLSVVYANSAWHETGRACN